MPRYVGYHEDHQLPFKQGQWVLIPKGTTIKTTYHGTRQAGRSYAVKIHHLGCGRNLPVGHPRHNESYPVENPSVVWPGPGGYWSEADINDVQPCPPEKIPTRPKSY